MIEIIPAIDIIEGKCVRLEQGDFSRVKEYSSDPVAMARSFEEAGIKRLHLVDLDGARTGNPKNLSVLEAIASATALEIDFGGGVKKEEDLISVLNAGAAMVTLGSVPVKDPEAFARWIRKYGEKRIFLGADVNDGKVSVSGWMEDSGLELISFLKEKQLQGVKNVFVTDIKKDGMLQGPSLALYKEILKEVPGLELTASGGISSMDDLKELEEIGMKGAILGKALYEGRIKLTELRSMLC